VRLLCSAAVNLDTPYFGGSNTAYDTLVAAAPAVTLPGDQPRSRYMAALFESVGIDECTARSAEEYVRIAVRLGSDPAARAALSDRIREASLRAFENHAAVEDLSGFLLEAQQGS
jgi:predicted O-linked N-acetylglucosamine transferase (SPINDLY family)